MADYDEAGYYELQLNNKQLVFFFMAAVAIAVVVFLCGVMVGRGVRDATIAAAGRNITSRPEQTPPQGQGAMTPAEVRRELDYQRRLESPKADNRLEGSSPSSSPEKLVAKAKKTTTVPPPAAKPAPKKAPPKAASQLGSPSGTFTIQVVALKTQAAADQLVQRLKAKNYRAYVEPGGETGLFRVRVGRFASRGDAEKVAQMLRDSEKFKPYITQ
jgi:cell division septation protein DedD